MGSDRVIVHLTVDTTSDVSGQTTLWRNNRSMRDKRFVAEHRGGPLKKEQHYQLINWACDCAEHVMHLLSKSIDDRLRDSTTGG